MRNSHCSIAKFFPARKIPLGKIEVLVAGPVRVNPERHHSGCSSGSPRSAKIHALFQRPIRMNF